MENLNQLSILLSTHHLLEFQGSELFTLNIGKSLVESGHKVFLYSAYQAPEVRNAFQACDIQTAVSLEEFKHEKFDVAHVHHNINAIEVRNFFPTLPILFVSHGVLPFLEQPPAIGIPIERYLAVSEEVLDNLLSSGVPREKIFLFRNPIDPQRFYPYTPIHHSPKRALVLSNRMDQDTEAVIRQACVLAEIECKFVGARFGPAKSDEVPHLINEADIVFSLGRGAIETMMCGRIPVIFDYLGGDGMVTSESFYNLAAYNYSGRRTRKKYSVQELVEILRQYRQESGEELRTVSLLEFSIENQVKKLINHYQEIRTSTVNRIKPAKKAILDGVIATIRETRHYSIETTRLLTSIKQPASAASPSNEQLIRIIGEADRSVGQGYPEIAIAILQTARIVFSERVEIYDLLSTLLINQGEYLAAEETLLNGLSNDPYHIGLLFRLGSIRYLKGDLNGSKQAFLNVLEAEPGNQEALENLSIVLSAIDELQNQNSNSNRLGYESKQQ